MPQFVVLVQMNKKCYVWKRFKWSEKKAVFLKSTKRFVLMEKLMEIRRM